MVFIVREAYGAVSAGLLETIFSTVALQTIFGEVLRSVFADLGPFWVPSGIPGRSILLSKSSLVGSLIFDRFWDDFWEGPAEGFGLLEYAESANLDQNLVTPCTLKGGGEYKGFAPCRRPHCQLVTGDW